MYLKKPSKEYPKGLMLTVLLSSSSMVFLFDKQIRKLHSNATQKKALTWGETTPSRGETTSLYKEGI